MPDYAPDAYGVINESYFSLRFPRPCYDTHPDLSGAVLGGMEMLANGASKVSIVTVQINHDRPYEKTVLLEMDAVDDLQEILYDIEHAEEKKKVESVIEMGSPYAGIQ